MTERLRRLCILCITFILFVRALSIGETAAALFCIIGHETLLPLPGLTYGIGLLVETGG